jgi:hypothetical protein
MNLKSYYIPALIGAAALGAIWYLARQNAANAATLPVAPSTAGNDTINPSSASGAAPNSFTSSGTTSPGISSTDIANPWGITNGW